LRSNFICFFSLGRRTYCQAEGNDASKYIFLTLEIIDMDLERFGGVTCIPIVIVKKKSGRGSQVVGNTNVDLNARYAFLMGSDLNARNST